MVSSCINKKALLIGNGINQLDKKQSVSWGELLNELKSSFNIDVDLDNEFKPFPLGFDEMLHRKGASNNFDDQLKNLKISIKKNIDSQLDGKPGYNDYHKRIMVMDYDDILTTNYDYGLEKSFVPNFFEFKRELAQNKQEIKFSLKRHYKLDCNIWHIHGELSDSRNLSEGSKYYNEESIMIGYEHYTSYLEKIQENFKGKSGIREIENQGLLTRIKNNNLGVFWTDIFFTHNLDIIGQGLDFSENHLWWIINQRANLIRKYNEKHGILVDNTIRYFYPIIENNNVASADITIEESVKKNNSNKKSKAVAELLIAFKVDTFEIRCNSYEEFYDKFILGNY